MPINTADPEVPWRPELLAHLIRFRLVGLSALALSVSLTIDLTNVLGWVAAFWACVAMVNIANYRRFSRTGHLSPINGFLDSVSPLLVPIWVPSMLPACLVISLGSLVICRLGYGRRPANYGVTVATLMAVGFALRTPTLGIATTVAVYGVTALRTLIALNIVTRNESRLSHQMAELANSDSLTGLHNRKMLWEEMEAALACQDLAEPVAVVMIDLNGFKNINDSLGHKYGDLVLRDVADRLRCICTPHGGLVARTGGDEFAVLFRSMRPDLLAAIVNDLDTALSEPALIDGVELSISGSVGAARATEHSTPEDLLSRADHVMYAMKRKSRGSNESVNNETAVELLREIKAALLSEQFQLLYQPIYDLTTREIVNLEALIRWNHPERGLIMPGEFIELAEMSGLIAEITAWVIDHSISDLGQWTLQHPTVGLSINVSGSDLDQVRLRRVLQGAIEREGVDSSLITIEITETIAVTDRPETRSCLDAIAELGVKLAIDDFGSGHATLDYLRRLRANEVKLDRSLTANIVADSTRQIIVRSIVGLAHELNLLVVAEGIEDPNAADVLQSLGCELGQGFHLGRPQLLSSLQFRPPGSIATSGARVETSTGFDTSRMDASA